MSATIKTTKVEFLKFLKDNEEVNLELKKALEKDDFLFSLITPRQLTFLNNILNQINEPENFYKKILFFCATILEKKDFSKLKNYININSF